MSQWKEYKLRDLVEVINGYAFKSSDFIANKNDGALPVIKIKNVANGDVNIDGCQYHYYNSSLDKFTAIKGDILIALTGNHPEVMTQVVGDVSRYKLDEKALINQRVAKILAKQDVNSDFIYYFFKDNTTHDYLASQSAGSANQANISKGDIENMPILLPTISEQTAIAEVLSSLDDKIDLLHRQNKTLEAMAETLFRQWFVEEKEGSWGKGNLGDLLASIESGSRPKGGINPDLKYGVPSIGAENINGIGIYDYSKTKYVTDTFFESMKRGLIKNYDVLIYKDGAYVGRKGMFGNGFPFVKCTVNEHVFILRANERANQFFLYFLLQEEELAQLNANSAQPGLNQVAMKSFEITIPPVELIIKFGDEIKPLIDKIFFNSTQIRTLTQLRDTLLPKLMSGEVRVKIN